MSEPAIGKHASNDDDMALVKSAALRLSEHFDSVLIFATKMKGGEVVSFERSEGNWYASYGLVREWQLRKDEQAKIFQRGLED